MSVTNPAASALRDERLPELETLLAAGIPEPLEAAMASSGVTVEAAEAVQVTHWPGRSVTVRYKAELVGPGVQGPINSLRSVARLRLGRLWSQADPIG